MSAAQHKARGAVPRDIEQAMESFSEISEGLLASYEALSERAEHVEAELCRTNKELAGKVSELDALTHHLEAILESLPSGVVVRDAHGSPLRANDAALEILGLAGQTITAESFPDPFSAEGDERARSWKRPDGAKLVLASRYSPVVTQDGETLGSVEILDDQTEFTRMSERVHVLDKMAALGTMAGGIAHEIRNPMNAIKGFAALLLREVSEDAKHRQWAHRICEGATEVDSIIRSILSFSEPERLQLETIAVRQLVDSALRAALEGLGSDADPNQWNLTTDVADIRFRGDRIKLRHALRNLIVNAIDVQPDGGSVHIEVTHTNDQLCIRVSDAGPGFSPDVAQRATDPFFTTRADGTGLGLALVHNIAQLHGGRFEVADEPSHEGGAAVLLHLPQIPATGSGH